MDHLVLLGGLIRSEGQGEGFEIVRSGGLSWVMASQCTQEVLQARHHAGLGQVVSPVGPFVARRSMSTTGHSAPCRDVKPVVASDLDASQRPFHESQCLRKNFSLQRGLSVAHLDNHTCFGLTHGKK